MFKLFEKLKSLFSRNKIPKEKLRSLKFGDVIWLDVKKYNDVFFKKGHTKRPYFVVKVVKDKVVCLPFTHRRQTSFTIFQVNDNFGSLILSYGLFKIKFKKFVAFTDKDDLTSWELSKIAKRITLYFDKDLELQKEVKPYIKFIPNDIVISHDDDNVDRYHVVYDVMTTDGVRRLKCYEFSKKKKKGFVEVEKNFFIIDKIREFVDNDPKLKYFNTFKEYKLNSIKRFLEEKKHQEKVKKQKEKKKQKKKDTTFDISEIPVGCEIRYKGNLFYYIGKNEKGHCLISYNYSKLEYLTDEVPVRKAGSNASQEQLNFLQKMYLYN